VTLEPSDDRRNVVDGGPVHVLETLAVLADLVHSKEASLGGSWRECHIFGCTDDQAQDSRLFHKGYHGDTERGLVLVEVDCQQTLRPLRLFRPIFGVWSGLEEWIDDTDYGCPVAGLGSRSTKLFDGEFQQGYIRLVARGLLKGVSKSIEPRVALTFSPSILLMAAGP
jgi:hypothetical protein